MAKNKPKNTEHDLKSELHKKPAKPVTKPVVNQKTQQKKKKKKKPNEEKRNQQRVEVQRFIGAVNRLKKQIRLPRYSIFQTIDIKIVTKMLKKDVRRVIVVQPVLKDCSLGYVKPMEYRYDNTWTVDIVKKDIATAILTPKYSLTLSEDTEMNLKHEVWDMVKRRKEVNINAEFIPLVMREVYGYFWLANAVLYGFDEKGNPAEHRISNAAIDETGKITFTYYQTRFSYEDGTLKNSKASEQKRLADFINANADEIRKCIDARAKTDGKLELTLTTGEETGSLHAVLTIDDKKYKKKMAKTVDGEAFEAWVEVVTEEHHKEKDMFIKKVQAKQRKLKIYGSLLHLTILRSIARREGCEWPENDRYEWIENIIEKEIKKVQAKQTSMMFGFDDVVQAVNDLIMCGLLRKTDKKTFTGRYSEEFAPRAKNMTLKPGTDYMIFAQLPFKRKFDFSEFSDIDWLDWIKYRKTEWQDVGDEAVLLPTKSGNEELCSELSIFEHSSVVLSCPDEMRVFLTGRPQTWVDYALTMNEIAETDGEKRYWLMVRRMMG